MHQELQHVTLRDGQSVRLLCVRPPTADWAPRIATFLVHKGEPWNWHIRANLDGHNDQLEQRFFIALCDDRIVSHLMVVEKHRVAILAHVYTDPNWRGKGISTALMKAMTDDFRTRGGVAMHLHTTYGSQAFKIYRRFGFEPISPEAELMAWILQHREFEAMFAPGPLRTERVCWTHWPLVQKLMLRPEGDWLRSGALGFGGVCNAEDGFVELMFRLSTGAPLAGTVLVNPAGMVVGLTSLLPWKKTLPTPALEFDAYVHPSAADHLDEFIRSIELPNDRPILCHVDSASSRRLEALRQIGFGEIARIERAAGLGNDSPDLLILERRRK